MSGVCVTFAYERKSRLSDTSVGGDGDVNYPINKQHDVRELRLIAQH